MGITPLTKREWFLAFVCMMLCSMIGAFLWSALYFLLFPHVMRILVLGSILGLSVCLICFLMWTRLFFAHLFWLKLWVITAPMFLSSIILLPIHPVIALSLVWCATMLFALWGYYRCFYPILGLETSLHRARFAHRHELATLFAKESGETALLIGINHWYALFRRFVLVRSTKMRRELGNLLIVAPTRSGKSLLATSQLLSWKHSAIVNDVKGELFQHTAGYRATLGKVFVIDPTGVGHSYDPLQGKETEDKLFSAAANMLFEAEERERIFTQRATVMLTQLFAAAKKEKVAPLPYVRHITRLGLEATARRLNTLSPDLATQFLDVSFTEAHFSDRFLHSAWSTLTTKLRPLLTETVVRCFTRSDFTPEQIMRGKNPVTVYLRWKEQDLLALSPLVRLLWGSLIDELITSFDSNQGKGCKPVLLLIDEAGRTVIPMLADQATTVVGRGISLWIAIQSLSQLEAVYGKPRAQVLKDNMDTQLYYRPTDLATARYLELRCGNKSAYAKSTSSRGEGNRELKSEGRSERPIPLLTAQEIMKLKDHEIIGFHRDLPPFKIRRLEWWRHTSLKQRQSIPAPQLSSLPPLATIPLETASNDLDEDGY